MHLNCINHAGYYIDTKNRKSCGTAFVYESEASCSVYMCKNRQTPEDEDECANPNGGDEGQIGGNIGGICRNPRPASRKLIRNSENGNTQYGWLWSTGSQ